MKGSRPSSKNQSSSSKNVSFENVKVLHKSKDPRKDPVQIAKTKHSLPGNSTLPLDQNQQFQARENRYGLFGDNGYGDLVEIKKRQISKEEKKAVMDRGM